MGKVTEGIFSGTTVVIPMADVQHIEKLKTGGIWVITKHTKYDFEQDSWANPIYLSDEEAESFLKSWCVYRAELESETLLPTT